VAIVLVVACHLGLVPGGWVGVDVFFVLSGYLITRLLMERRSLRDFYAGRARRLLPALALLLGTVAVVGGVAVLPSVAIGASYTMNFARFEGQSFSPLGHLWSLAQEEQFYLLWPLLLYAVRPRSRALLAAGLMLCSLTALHVAVMYGAQFSRLYFGPDTHALPLLAGCLLALVPGVPRATAARIVGIGGAAVLALAVRHDAKTTDEFETALLLATVGGAALVVAALEDPRLLCGRVLQRLGLYSYGIYLWHYPLIVWLPDGLAVVLTIVVAAVSFHLVEVPIRRRLVSAKSKRTFDTPQARADAAAA
jgi:peptidoglycan/LPS O-acetylase OafA/YrhL